MSSGVCVDGFWVAFRVGLVFWVCGFGVLRRFSGCGVLAWGLVSLAINFGLLCVDLFVLQLSYGLLGFGGDFGLCIVVCCVVAVLCVGCLLV